MEKMYVSKQRGFRLSLTPELTEETGRKSIIFKTTDPKIVTDNLVIQSFIENHDAFKRGKIIKVDTPEEIALKAKLADQKSKLEHWRKIVILPGVNVKLEEMKDEELRSLADEIGAEVSRDGSRLKKAEILENVNELIYKNQNKE